MTTLETLKTFRENIDCIIYHDPCQDGQTAAWIAYSYLWKRRDTLTLIPRDNNKTPTDMTLYTDKVVLCLDVLPHDYAIIISKAKQVIVLDHHATNAELCGSDKDWAYFDMNKSGTGLAWEYFYDSLEIFEFLDYIQQRDLWRFNEKTERAAKSFCRGLITIDNTLNDIHDYFNVLFNLACQNFDFEKESITESKFANTLYSLIKSYAENYYYHNYLTNFYSMENIIKLGETIDATINAKIQQYIANCQKHTLTITYNTMTPATTITYSNVYIINTTEGITSELGNAFMEQTDADFVIMWYYSNSQKNYYYSLRSCDQKVDVGLLAKNYGGGGHRNAAGISGPFINTLFAQEIL